VRGASAVIERHATGFLTNINKAAAFVVRMKSSSCQEDAMGSKSKSAKVSNAARARARKSPGRRVRGAATDPAEGWEQIAEVLDECDDEIDCQRIVQGDGGRSLPFYYDDYN
jgi:hypothetical protein